MDEIIFHLKVPLDGTSEDIVSGFIDFCIPSAVIALLFVIIVLLVSRKKKWVHRISICAIILFSLFCATNGIAHLWKELNISKYVKNQKTQSTFIQKNYVDPRSVSISFPEQKRNLIYIYLESMENTYASQAIGGAFDNNYIPELAEIASQNISFSNNDTLGGAHSAPGSTWTMGAMFAQTSGLPLLIPINENAMDQQSSFLPEIVGLGDILEEQNYNQVLFIGSNADFGGRRNYFTQHGDYEMNDYYYAMQEGWIPNGYYQWWGYEDEKLFEAAMGKLTELSSQSQPFNFTLLTADTHFEDGYVCPLCDNQYGDQYANVIACSSRQVSNFIMWIQQQPFYQNTSIILCGDHLTMDSDFCTTIDSSYKRTVYNAFINPAVTTSNIKNRQFTTMDMFPTTLASMGASIAGERLNLGTNLFSSMPTLSEQYTLETIDAELQKKSTFYENFTKDITQ